MKSLFNFFGTPLKYSKNILINKKEILFEKKILKFKLSKELRLNLVDDTNILFLKVYKNLENQGKILAYFFDGEERFPAIVKKNNKIIFNFDPEETINFLLNEKYVCKKKPLYIYLPFHYHKIFFRFALIKISNLIKPKPRAKFPDWPIEKSVETLRLVFLECLSQISKKEIKTKPFWPKNKTYAIALTHDVDTKKGFKNIGKFAFVEEKYGFNSTWFLVGNYYKLEDNLVKKLIGKGHEIACHGYNHDNKLAYLSKEKILSRLKKSMTNLNAYNVKGFRSPSLLTSQNLNQQISKLFLYDSSIADTEKFPVDSKASGCCSIFPFIEKNLIKIPITLPMDATLIFLGYKPKKILKIWISKLKYIKKLGGAAIIDVHPEPAFSANKKMLKIYEEFLKYTKKDKDAWITNLGEIAVWWRKRIQ